MDYWTLAQIQRRSLWTTKNAHNSIDNQYKFLSMRINLPTIIIYYWPPQHFHRQSPSTTKHVHNFTDNQNKLQSMHTNPPFSLKTTDHNRNHANNHKLLNTQRVPLTITIKYWVIPISHQQSYTTEQAHSSNDNHFQLLNTTAIPPTITIKY